jgi:general secretion pathway protein C
VISLERSSLAQTTIVSLVTLGALALLGWVLAYWTWAWLAPRPEPRALVAAVPGGGIASAQGLFGNLQRGQNIAPTGIAIKLLGVVAATGGRRSYAVAQLDARQIIAVREGEDIAPGVRLAEVHPDHVILDRNGTRESLAWPQKHEAAESAALPINK